MPQKETTIVIFGVGPRFKGGIANYTTSLARALAKTGDVCVKIVSWTQPYPAVIPRDFVDHSSKEDLLGGTDIEVFYLTNYNNPFSWRRTSRKIVELQPDIVIIQWALALQGLPIGFIARRLHRHTFELIFDLHNVAQKEASLLDTTLTKYGLGSGDSYIVHSYETADELRQLLPRKNFILNEDGRRATKNKKTIIKLFHPVYDMFRPDENFNVQQKKQHLGLKKYVFLFFGYIRKYKGLHDVIDAFARLCADRDDVSLLIVGESMWSTLDPNKLSTKLKFIFFRLASFFFISKEKSGIDYRPLDKITPMAFGDAVKVIHKYVANEEVHEYFQISDCIVLFYSAATISGVESVAFNFNLPILATRVGHLSETVQDGINGYLAEPGDIDSMTAVMKEFLDNPISAENVASSAQKLSWEIYAAAILNR